MCCRASAVVLVALVACGGATPITWVGEEGEGEEGSGRRGLQLGCSCLNGGVCGAPAGGGHRRVQTQQSCICPGGFSGPLCETAGGGSGCDPGYEPGVDGQCIACTGTLVSEDGTLCHACPDGGLGFGHTQCIFLGPQPSHPPPPPSPPLAPPPPPITSPPPPGSALAQFEPPLQGSLNKHNIVVKGRSYSARPDAESCAQSCLDHAQECLSFDYGVANGRCYLGTARVGDDATATITVSTAYQYYGRLDTNVPSTPAPPPAPTVPTDCDVYTDPCCVGPCQHGGMCSPCTTHNCLVQRVTFLCECPRGFGGNTCETNVDECASGPCMNEAACEDMTNDYRCTCASGFTGNNCERREAIQAPAPPAPSTSTTTGPAPPACTNEYDVGDNSCGDLLVAGYTCAAFFCADSNACAYSGMCDRSCGFCGATSPPPPPPEGRGGTSTSSSTGGRGTGGGRGAGNACDNLYDTSAGEGSCDTMISEGYSCATDFCGTCGYAGYCDGSCNTCPVVAPPPPPAYLPTSSGGEAQQVTSCTSSKSWLIRPKSSRHRFGQACLLFLLRWPHNARLFCRLPSLRGLAVAFISTTRSGACSSRVLSNEPARSSDWDEIRSRLPRRVHRCHMVC